MLGAQDEPGREGLPERRPNQVTAGQAFHITEIPGHRANKKALKPVWGFRALRLVYFKNYNLTARLESPASGLKNQYPNVYTNAGMAGVR